MFICVCLLYFVCYEKLEISPRLETNCGGPNWVEFMDCNMSIYVTHEKLHLIPTVLSRTENMLLFNQRSLFNYNS